MGRQPGAKRRDGLPAGEALGDLDGEDTFSAPGFSKEDTDLAFVPEFTEKLARHFSFGGILDPIGDGADVENIPVAGRRRGIELLFGLGKGSKRGRIIIGEIAFDIEKIINLKTEGFSDGLIRTALSAFEGDNAVQLFDAEIGWRGRMERALSAEPAAARADFLEFIEDDEDIYRGTPWGDAMRGRGDGETRRGK